jgi:hypothetical protein
VLFWSGHRQLPRSPDGGKSRPAVFGALKDHVDFLQSMEVPATHQPHWALWQDVGTARLRGNAVDADQDFDTFLAKWTEKRIWRVADVLGDVDQQYLAEKRSIELIQLTLEKGFSGELTEIAQRYGSVLHFVKNLFSKADNRPRSPPWQSVAVREGRSQWSR